MASVNLDIAQRLDITCRQGDSFGLVLNITDSSGVAIALTPYTFAMEVRDPADDAVVIPNTEFSFTKDADSIAGKLKISVTAANIDTAGTFVYDLETTLVADVQTWLFGTFTVNENVTEVA